MDVDDSPLVMRNTIVRNFDIEALALSPPPPPPKGHRAGCSALVDKLWTRETVIGLDKFICRAGQGEAHAPCYRRGLPTFGVSSKSDLSA